MSIHYEVGYGGKPSPITIMTNLHHLQALIPSQKGRQAPIRPKMALWLRRQALYSPQRPLLDSWFTGTQRLTMKKGPIGLTILKDAVAAEQKPPRRGDQCNFFTPALSYTNKPW